MFGGSTSPIVYYQLGQWSAENAEHNSQQAAYALGFRTVKQSYLNYLHAEIRSAQAATDHNYRMGEEWIARARHLEAEKAALLNAAEDTFARLKESDAALDRANERWSREREEY